MFWCDLGVQPPQRRWRREGRMRSAARGGGSCAACSAETPLCSAMTEHMEILAAKYQSLCRSSANGNFCQRITWVGFEGFHNKRHVLT